jgi:hypothetical protein
MDRVFGLSQTTLCREYHEADTDDGKKQGSSHKMERKRKEAWGIMLHFLALNKPNSTIE